MFSLVALGLCSGSLEVPALWVFLVPPWNLPGQHLPKITPSGLWLTLSLASVERLVIPHGHLQAISTWLCHSPPLFLLWISSVQDWINHNSVRLQAYLCSRVGGEGCRKTQLRSICWFQRLDNCHHGQFQTTVCWHAWVPSSPAGQGMGLSLDTHHFLPFRLQPLAWAALSSLLLLAVLFSTYYVWPGLGID